MKLRTLREVRQRAGFTQDQLAAVSGVKQSTISSLERGTRRRPAYDTVTRLAKALGIAPSKLRFSDAEPAAKVSRRRDKAGHTVPREAVA